MKRLVTPALLLVPIALALGLGAITAGSDFLSQHWLPLVAGGAVLGVALRLGVSLVLRTGRGVIRFGQRREALGESGAVMTEFVIVLMPFLLVLFGIMQMALISMGRILVSYSAFAAARAAIVIVPENSMGEAPNKLAATLSSSRKLGAIRNAASYAMIPASPPIDQVANEFAQGYTDYLKEQAIDTIGDAIKEAVGGTIGTIIGGIAEGAAGYLLSGLQDQIMNSLVSINTSDSKSSVGRAFEKDGWGGSDNGVEGAIKRALRKFIYARMATIVTLHAEDGALRHSFAWNEPIKAKVTFLFMCRIPIAMWFAGKRFYELPASTKEAIATSPLGPIATMGGIPGYYIGLTASHVLVNQGVP